MLVDLMNSIAMMGHGKYNLAWPVLSYLLLSQFDISLNLTHFVVLIWTMLVMLNLIVWINQMKLDVIK